MWYMQSHQNVCFRVTCSETGNLLPMTSHLIWKLNRVYLCLVVLPTVLLMPCIFSADLIDFFLRVVLKAYLWGIFLHDSHFHEYSFKYLKLCCVRVITRSEADTNPATGYLLNSIFNTRWHISAGYIVLSFNWW